MSSYYYSDAGSVVKDNEEARQLRYHSFFTVLSQIFGIILMILVGYWCATWDGGYSWNNYDGGKVKYHYTLMTTGLVFLQGEAILVYRMFRHERKSFLKALHGLMHLIVFVLYLTGLIAMIQFKHSRDYFNMYSAHSWVGLIVMVTFIVQYIGGFVNFGFPKTSPEVRAWYLPIHRACGLIIFAVSCAQALMGFAQEAMELQKNNYWFRVCYLSMDCHGAGAVLNLIVLFIILYGASVVYLATSEKYRRQPTPDEIDD
uniref:Cytochrome b561 domain-containing protein n=1 Tax=Plectus sambesii TaxID=2011161 RepID=A0A914XH59_9BILA